MTFYHASPSEVIQELEILIVHPVCVRIKCRIELLNLVKTS